MNRTLEVASPAYADEMLPVHVNPIQWQQSVGLARQICARVFRDGGRATEAVAAFGLTASADTTWDKAVEMIAGELSRQVSPRRRAA